MMPKAQPTPVGSDPDTLSGQAQGRLKSFVARINKMIDERDDLNADIREIFAEAKGEGFDIKTMRKAVRIARMDKAKRQEEEALLDLYLSALDLL